MPKYIGNVVKTVVVEAETEVKAKAKLTEWAKEHLENPIDEIDIWGLLNEETYNKGSETEI